MALCTHCVDLAKEISKLRRSEGRLNCGNLVWSFSCQHLINASDLSELNTCPLCLLLLEAMESCTSVGRLDDVEVTPEDIAANITLYGGDFMSKKLNLRGLVYKTG